MDDLYARAKARVLGPRYAGRGYGQKGLEFRLQWSLPGIFAAASAEEGAQPDIHTMDRLLRTAEHYLDSQASATKAQVVHRVAAWLRDAWARGKELDPAVVLGGELEGVWARATRALETIVDTEATTARNVGGLEGIVRVNEAAGVDDPAVYFVVVRDGDLCDECRRLHLLPDNVTPRVYRLSEVSHAYHVRGSDRPSIGGEHPHCRCSMVTLLPGYGFDSAGMVRYVGAGHDEAARQAA